MKTILLACGSGVATSTAVAAKVKRILEDAGYSDSEFTLVQCAIAEAPSKSQSADILIATTSAPVGIACPFYSGIPFLTGVGIEPVKQALLELMNS